MAKTRAKKEETAESIAEELLQVRYEISLLRASDKELSAALRKLMAQGEKQGVFRFVDSTRMEIADRDRAFVWAQKYAPQTITIDTSAARAVFLGDIATGSMGTVEDNGFALKTSQQLKEVGTAREVAGELPDII